MNILQHPGDYAVAYAGVPVTDLVLRLGYHDASYQAIFSAQQHIGKTVSGDIQEYLKRSPITYADKLDTPLLIHGNTNDEDVNVIEIQRFVTALKAAGKTNFQYKIYENAPGGQGIAPRCLQIPGAVPSARAPRQIVGYSSACP
jgi:dipeptidyl aminopeptidase/acylaminoacyl peptidase